jgi:hypothetical protein
VLSAADNRGRGAISQAFPDVLYDGPGRPTLLITTTGTCGAGLDGL